MAARWFWALDLAGARGHWCSALVPVRAGRRWERASAPSRSLGSLRRIRSDSRRYLYSDSAVRVGTLSGEHRALTASDPTRAYTAPSWSPGGDRVAYVRIASELEQRYAVDVRTGEVPIAAR